MKRADVIMVLMLAAVAATFLMLPSYAQTPANLLGKIAVDGNGNVYVVMGSGSALPEGVYAYTPDGKVIGAYPLQRCSDVAIGNDGCIYVSNLWQKSIERLETNGIFNAVWVEADPGRHHGCIAVDRAGNIYTMESNIPVPPNTSFIGCILKLSPDGQVLETIGGSPDVPLNRTATLSISHNGTIYLADSGRCIMAIYPDGGRGRLTPAGTGISTPGRLTDVAAGEDGYLYVGNANASCVYRMADNGTIVATWEGCGPDRFNTPYAVATDGKGRVYVSDLWGQRVTWFDANRYRFGENSTENIAGKGIIWGDVVTADSATTGSILGDDIMPRSMPGYTVAFAFTGLFLAGIILCLRRRGRR